MSALLSMQQVTAGYSPDINILQDLSIDIPEGEIIGLVGLNGAGKSTVLKTIFGFLHPHSGSIFFDGIDISSRPPHQMVELGIWLIPQDGGLFSQFSVEENLRLPIESRRAIAGDLTRTEAEERVQAAFQRFPILFEKRRHRTTSLSGGQRKILEFAIAYAQRPKLCLIDEPSIGLSPKIAEEIFEEIGKFPALGTSVLVIDHNIRDVIAISNFVYVLTLGTVAARGDRDAFEGDLHEQVKEWLGLNF